jgi:hypothetical protein
MRWRNSRTALLVAVAALSCLLLIVTALADSPTTADADHAPAVPTAPPVQFLLGIAHNGTVPDRASGNRLPFRDEDILAYDNGPAQQWSIFFDGSDYNLGSADVEDFELLDDGTLIFTVDKNAKIKNTGGAPDPLMVTDRDIVQWDPTTDTFSIYLLGADLGLTNANEDIDALGILPNGHLLISTIGTATANGPVTAFDEDILDCDPIAKTCVLYFDGSDVLLTAGSEDVDGVWYDNTSGHDPGNLYFTTKGNWSVKGANGTLSGNRDDVIGCYLISSGVNTVCHFYLVLNSQALTINQNNLDGIWFSYDTIIASGVAAATADIVTDVTEAEDALDLDEYNEAMSLDDAEIDVHDFVAVTRDLYLPAIVSER